MKILLVYPPLTLYKTDVSEPAKAPLIGLGYIAAVLQNKGHKVKILDCIVSTRRKMVIEENFTRFGLSDSEIMDAIKSFEPDVVGVSCMFTSYFKDAHNVARIAKACDKNILVVFGGPHTSTFPEAVMKDENVDVGVIGEGEITVCELLERCKGGRNFDGVRGIIHRGANGEVRKENPRDFIKDLDELPHPARELMDSELDAITEENKMNKFLIRKPHGALLTSRGCPNSCYFCSVKLIWTRHWRARSAKNVVDEIEFLQKKYGYREFHFVDDNSSVSKERMRDICDEILKRKLDIKLATPTGIAIANLDKDILARMKRAGFYRLCFGIESGDPHTQKIIGKRINLEKAKEVIREANRLGFWTSGTFIIGFPHETMKEIRKTIDFAKLSGMDLAIFYLLTPQPGTEVYNIFKQEGLIDLDRYLDPQSDEWYKISVTYCNGFKNRYFSNKELQDILSGAYREFFIYKIFSIRSYIDFLRKIRSLEDLGYALRLATIPLNMMRRMILGKGLSIMAIRNKYKPDLETIA